jgi:hypothetical protein
VRSQGDPVDPVAYTFVMASILFCGLFLVGVLVWRMAHGF